MIEKNNLSEDDKKQDEFEDILALMDEVDACLGRNPKSQPMTMNQCLKEYVHKDAIRLIGHVIPRYTPLTKAELTIGYEIEMDSEYGLHVECRDRRGQLVFRMDVTGYRDKNLEHYDERFIRLSPIFLDMGSQSLTLAGMFRLSKELARLEAELNLKVKQKWARVKK